MGRLVYSMITSLDGYAEAAEGDLGAGAEVPEVHTFIGDVFRDVRTFLYGRRMYETWYKMIALIQSGLDLQPLITHRIGAEAFGTGFAAMRSGEAGKVVMDWG